MTRSPIRIAGISGSLRKGSYNTAALRALRELAAGRLDIDIITLHGIDLFDDDVEARVETRGWPPRTTKPATSSPGWSRNSPNGWIRKLHPHGTARAANLPTVEGTLIGIHHD